MDSGALSYGKFVFADLENKKLKKDIDLFL